MTRNRVTIRDVAAAAGVSHQTVSRVINDSDAVRSSTRQRVEEAIETLGYQPNAIARSMASGRTRNLACFSPNLTDYTFASIIDGAEREARRHGYFLMSASAEDAETFDLLVDQLVAGRRADGMLVINPYADERHHFLPAQFPTVFAGARPREEAANSVALDDVAVGFQATRHLINHGHRRIGMVTGPPAEDCTQDRSLGYRHCLEAESLELDPSLIVEGDWSATSGYQAFKHFAGMDRLPTAIFAQNDQMAVGILHGARDAGLLLPDELSVIGVDDIPLAAYFAPPLTTVRQDFAEIGRQAVRLLISAVEESDAEPEHLLLAGDMIVRRSTAAPATAGITAESIELRR